jgi:putative ABC transport system permease protein
MDHMKAWLDDVRGAVRALVRSPLYTVMAVLTMAIGLGATTAAVSVVGTVLLKPLPYPDAERLVAFYSAVPTFDKIPPSYPDLEDFRAQNTVLAGVAYVAGAQTTMRRTGGSEHVLLGRVTSDYFPVLRARPAVGRVLTALDTLPGAPPVAVISHALWARDYASDPRAIGQMLDVDEGSFTIVGVLDRGQSYPKWAADVENDVFVPFEATRGTVSATRITRDNHSDARSIARLAPSVTREQAQRQLNIIAARLGHEYPATDSGFSVNLVPLRDDVVGNVRPAMLVLSVAVALVLLLACADVANLGLVRATGRTRELAVRTALGAGRGRIVLSLLTESGLVAAVAGLVGIGIGIAAVRFLRVSSNDAIPRLSELTVNWRAVSAAVIATCVAAVLTALAPIVATRQTDLTAALKSSGRGTRGDRGGVRLRSAIVTIQLGLAMVLVVGAGLLIKSFARLRAVQRGFDPSHLVVWQVDAPRAATDSTSQLAFYRREMAAAASVLGVSAVSMVNHLPLSGGGANTAIGADGGSVAADTSGAGYLTVTPGYFHDMAIPVLRGRGFIDADLTSAAAVAVISRATADHYWPGVDPIGHTMTVLNAAHGNANFNKPFTATVVGIAGDAKRLSLDESLQRVVYLPFTKPVWTHGWLVIRTAGDPSRMVAPIRAALAAADPTVPVADVQTFDALTASGLDGRRFATTLLTSFSTVALLLAALGIYGVVSYAVTQRVPEIGVRMALGARGGDITRLVLSHMLGVVGLGLAIGAIGATALAGEMRSLLFGVTSLDPATFIGVGALLAMVAFAASYAPARRAARVDPVVALRAE